MCSKLYQALSLFMTNTYNRHRPIYNPSLYILKARNRQRLLDVRSFHRKFIMTTLEMLMCQYRAAYNWQIGI